MVLLSKKIREYRARFRRIGNVFSHTFEGKATGEFLSELAIKRRRRWSHYVFNLIFALAFAAVVSFKGPRTPELVLYKVGEIADQNVISPVTADLDAIETVASPRDDLSKRVAPVFDFDDSVQDTWLKNWKQAFRSIRQDYYNTQKRTKDFDGNLVDTISNRIVNITGQSLSVRDVTFLHQNRFNQNLERLWVKLGETLLGRLISPTDLFPSYYSTGIVVRQINQALSETLIHDVSRIWSIENTRDYLRTIPPALKAEKSEVLSRVVDILCELVEPNLKFNPQLTQKRIALAVGVSKVPLVSVKKGQVLVRKGERITEAQAKLLVTLNTLTKPAYRFRLFLMLFFTLFVFVSVIFRMEITRKGFWRLPLKDALFFMMIALLNLLCVKYSYPYLRDFFKQFNLLGGVEYLMPISAGGIVIHLMMGKEAAYTFALIVSTGIGLMLDKSFYFTVWAFTVTASAIQSIKSCKQRTDLYRSGLWSGIIGALLVFTFGVTQSLGLKQIDIPATLVTIGLAFFSGLLAAVITSSLIPLLEALFGYTTNLKLLELSNFNHPLLHNLMLKAPGTYHHSVIVGSLAEIAADRIKANALLARVSAYYHDIGKMTKPMYFIENQTPNSNPHDQLAPSMSAKILFSHVKNGVRLGREHNLGNKIIDIIEQHHGTTLASYFFNKAKRTEDKTHEHVSEAEFRYPGPKPQSREAAVVMIADACEAATRSIPDPSPAKIQTMVHNIIHRRLVEEQFNDCDITLNDLQIIEDSFTRTLVSLYHHRIEYPGQRNSVPNIVPHPVNSPPAGPTKSNAG